MLHLIITIPADICNSCHTLSHADFTRFNPLFSLYIKKHATMRFALNALKTINRFGAIKCLKMRYRVIGIIILSKSDNS